MVGEAGEGAGDLMLASGSQDGYIRLWRVSPIIGDTEGRHAAAGAAAAHVGEKTADEASDELDDEMLDDFERRMTGDASGTTRAGATQLSTKAHVIDLSRADERYGISLEALLIGHEGWVTDVRWAHRDVSPAGGNRRLLSTSADNSMIVWAPEPSSAVWLAQHRFGEMNAKGLGLFGALWCLGTRQGQGERRGTRRVGVVANAWNGGFQRWCADVDVADAEGQAAEEWVAAWAPTGHGLAVKDLSWDPAHEYLVSVR